MVDVVSVEKRSAMMANIKNRDTRPEIKVRKHLHRLGYRYRLDTKVFGFKPDVVLSVHKTAIFVHGCFWHRHQGCKLASTPKSREGFWQKKFESNVNRDQRNIECLAEHCWCQIVIWECTVRSRKFQDFDFAAAIAAGGFHEIG